MFSGRHVSHNPLFALRLYRRDLKQDSGNEILSMTSAIVMNDYYLSNDFCDALSQIVSIVILLKGYKFN